jgi:hypothetical protein
MSASEDKLIFTIGRMNPPTSGHQGLIRAMMEEALKVGLESVYIVLSASVDKTKNPLKCSRKKELLVGDVSNIMEDLKRKWIAEKSGDVAVEDIRKCQVRVVCMDDPEIDSEKYGKHPILKCIGYLLDKWEEGRGKGETILFVGEDRKGDYGWISEYALEKMGRLTIVPVSRPSGAISATYVRGLAVDGNLEGFLREMESVGIVRERGQEVYLEIRRALGEKLKSRGVSKRKSENKNAEKKSAEKKSKKRTRVSTPVDVVSTPIPTPSSIGSIGSRTRSATRRKQGL